MPKKGKYSTDTELGIRPINVIKSLPAQELNDNEITKLFFHRFDADGLVMAYIDKQGINGLFGRVRKETQYRTVYRQLLEIMNTLDLEASIEEISTAPPEPTTCVTMEAGHLSVLSAHLKLLMLIKEMRDTQVAYFASRKGRYGDRKILAHSKKLEGDLDRLVSEQLASAETYLFTDEPKAECVKKCGNTDAYNGLCLSCGSSIINTER